MKRLEKLKTKFIVDRVTLPKKKHIRHPAFVSRKEIKSRDIQTLQSRIQEMRRALLGLRIMAYKLGKRNRTVRPDLIIKTCDEGLGRAR